LWALFHVLPRIAHVAGNAPLSQHNKILRTAKEFGDIPYATLNGLELYRADARRAGARSSIARLVACARNRFVGGVHTDPERDAANDAGVTKTDLMGELVRACTSRNRHVRRLDYARRPTSAGRSRPQSAAIDGTCYVESSTQSICRMSNRPARLTRVRRLAVRTALWPKRLLFGVVFRDKAEQVGPQGSL
jgi:hypothetical protein